MKLKGLFLLLALFVHVEAVEKLALQEIIYSANAMLYPSNLTGITWCGGVSVDISKVVANSVDNNGDAKADVHTLYGLDSTCNVTAEMNKNNKISVVLSFGALGDVNAQVDLVTNNTQTLITATSNRTLITPPAPTTLASNVTTPTPTTPAPTEPVTTDPTATEPPPTPYPVPDNTTLVTVTLNYRYVQPADVQNVNSHTAAVVVAVLEGLILGAILAVFIYRVYTGAKRSQNAAMYGADPYAVRFDATQNRSYDNNAWGNPPPRNNGISMDTMSPRTTQPTPQEARPNLVPVDLNSPQPRAPMPRPPADPLQDPWSDRVPAPGTRDQDPFDGYGY